VIPSDREHHRSEATLGVDILNKVFTIVKENNPWNCDSTIISAFLAGAGGALAWLIINQVGALALSSASTPRCSESAPRETARNQ
jgi:hypothetical protein